MVDHLTQKDAPYRIRQVGEQWYLRRPNGSIEQAFDNIDEAFASVRNDSGGSTAVVEILAGSTYMMKQLDPL
jgi:hypothetical protein